MKAARLLSSSAKIFFFQAEDGIRDFHVTGVQTCALPISGRGRNPSARPLEISGRGEGITVLTVLDAEVVRRRCNDDVDAVGRPLLKHLHAIREVEAAGRSEIGRASCRERVAITEVAGIRK